MRFNTNTIIPFGKHKGKVIGELMYEDPEYILWLDEKTDHHVFDSVVKIAFKNSEIKEIN